MATATHTPVTPAPQAPLSDVQLATELADAFHLIAECWSRGLRVPEELLQEVDHLLDRVEVAQTCRGNVA